ncbi:MAG: hypothetical protein SPI81_08035, partial [Candidatus Faecousia sp.]|nr:hypothetical protein [Candidatus Faecousia sp.]
FIGNQWEGVQSNGLPTPVFNFLKQVVLFQVATITSDNMAMQAAPLSSVTPLTKKELEKVADIITNQFSAIIERCKIVTKTREFLRNAAVDGDGCMHFYFDPTIENGQMVKGEIEAELIENTRVMFGNPNCRDVQRQPYIIIEKREIVEEVRYRAGELKKAGMSGIDDPDSITADSEKFQNKFDSYTDDKVTVLTYYYRNRDTGTIWCVEATEKGIIREAYDTEYKMYPLVWINWDYVHDCYHGQAMVTGLLPNQKFVNKAYAMVMLSLMTTAFPKIVYDKNRIRNWDGSVGTAVGVNGSIDNVAKTIDGASLNPQVTQFLELVPKTTKSFLGASDVALGDSRPDNTSAIIALQRAANTPMELTKQNLYQCIEDMGRIWMDIMSVRYGTRKVETKLDIGKPGEQPLGMDLPTQTFVTDFDFSTVRDVQLGIKQDVGASSYWSEIASMQTLDNLLMNHLITPAQYIERLPSGYITKKEELLAELNAAGAAQSGMIGQGTGISVETTSSQIPVQGGNGNGSLQRAINREGA